VRGGKKKKKRSLAIKTGASLSLAVGVTGGDPGREKKRGKKSVSGWEREEGKSRRYMVTSEKKAARKNILFGGVCGKKGKRNREYHSFLWC